MQLRVTVALATVCLVVAVGVVGASTLDSFHLTVDQYSPSLPQQRDGVYQRGEDEAKLKSKNKVLDHLQDDDYRSIALRSSIISNDLPIRIFEVDPKIGASSKKNFSTAKRENRPKKNSVRVELKNDDVDYEDVKTLDPFPLDANHPAELDDPFVADDTFQDQGPGSVEIYKLDLFKEKALLNHHPTATFNLAEKKAKSKVPKKSSHVAWKSKSSSPDYKLSTITGDSSSTSSSSSSSSSSGGSKSSSDTTTSQRAQSTFPDELKQSESPLYGGEDFGVGGVPELQVGCEGLEASSSHKLKRSVNGEEISTKRNEKKQQTTPSFNTMSLNFDYDLLPYEETDELLLLKRMESATAKPKVHRGDIGINFNHDYFPYLHRLDKIPTRGDLGSANSPMISEIVGTVGRRPAVKEEKVEGEEEKFARKQRKLLWLDEFNDEQSQRKGDLEREKREETLWGFDENEGVVSSDELPMNEKKHEGESIKNRTISEIKRIREEYDRSLEQRQLEADERWRRIREKESRRLAFDREREARRRMQEEEEEEEEEYRRRDESSRRRNDAAKQQTAEDIRQRWEEEHRRREKDERKLQEEQLRRRNHSRSRQKLEREERGESVENFGRNLTPEDRRSLEERHRQWILRRREEEQERERTWSRNRYATAPPSNLLRPESRVSEEQQERERENEKKLKEYIERNRPIDLRTAQHRPRHGGVRGNVTTVSDREEEYRRRKLEEERRLQEYVRRRQPSFYDPSTTPLGVPLEQRRAIEATRSLHDTISPRYPFGQEATRRHHGPSAFTYIDPWRSPDETARRRQEMQQHHQQRLEEEEERRNRMRQEALRREEEDRRNKSRKYEEERRRIEAARMEDERRRQELIEEQRRRAYDAAQRRQQSEGAKLDSGDRRQLEERRRQDAVLVPANLVLNENRRAIERERQRQEQARRRADAVARDNERRGLQNRTNEDRQREEHLRLLKEQRKRQEEARLNALPVSARIIIRSGVSSIPSRRPPVVISRDGFRNEIDFPGFDPYESGVEVARFPSPVTPRAPIKSPSPCTWAIVHCCPLKANRLVACFESLGCPGISWDYSPCRVSLIQAAREEITKFYADSEDYQ